MDIIFEFKTIENLRKNIKKVFVLFTYMILSHIRSDNVALIDDVISFYWTNDMSLTDYVALVDDVAGCYWTKY